MTETQRIQSILDRQHTHEYKRIQCVVYTHYTRKDSLGMRCFERAYQIKI